MDHIDAITGTKVQHAALVASESEAKRLTTIGRIGTAIYVGVVLAYVLCKWDQFADLQPNAVGDFLAGVAGPLALFWLVLGYLQQGRELHQNTAALLMQAQEMQEAAEQARQLVEVTREELQFSKQVRELELRQAAENTRPMFQYTTSDPIPITTKLNASGFLVSSYKLTVRFRNLGGDAMEVRVTQKKSDMKVTASPPGHISNMEEFFINFSYEWETGNDLPNAAFSIHHRGRDGVDRTEEWAIATIQKGKKHSYKVNRVTDAIAPNQSGSTPTA